MKVVIILCCLCASATYGQLPQMTTSPISPWYSTAIKRIFDAVNEHRSHSQTMKVPTASLYAPGCYQRTCYSKLTINEAVAFSITRARYIPLVKNGINVVDAEGSHVAVLVYSPRYVLWGNSVWRVRTWSKKKLWRKSKHKYVQLLNFST